MKLTSQEKEIILASIRDIPNYPKEGIIFKDITTLVNNPEAFQLILNHLEQRYKSLNLDYITGIDARGFIFAAALADRLKIGFVPVRKKGKLPATTVCEKYELEYGFDEVEMHLDAYPEKDNQEKPRTILIDDLIATGGTAEAAAKLINNIGAELVEACFIINLSFLEGTDRVEKIAPTYSVIDY